MVTSMWSMLDFCAFAPPLVEAILMHGARMPFKLGRFDFRWFKILRQALYFACQHFSAATADHSDVPCSPYLSTFLAYVMGCSKSMPTVFMEPAAPTYSAQLLQSCQLCKSAL